MKKLLLIFIGIALGVGVYIYQDPRLTRKLNQQVTDIINPKTIKVYRWQDKDGNWQASQFPPPAGIKYEVKTYEPADVNLTNTEHNTTKKAKQ